MAVLPPLVGAQLRYLRGLGHALDPVVSIGKDGLTEGVLKAIQAALLTHELVKVKLQAEAPGDRKEAAEELASQAGATLAQVLGRTFLLYKPHPKAPKIVLPKVGGKGKGTKTPKQATKDGTGAGSPLPDDKPSRPAHAVTMAKKTAAARKAKRSAVHSSAPGGNARRKRR